MSVYLWQYDLEPEFPFGTFEHTVYGNQDKLHWHNVFQIGLCLGGKGKYIFTHKEYDVSQGDIFLVNKFENHVATSEPPESILFFFMIFQPDLIALPGNRLFEFEYLSPFMYDPKTFCNKIDGSSPTGRKIGEIIREIKEVWERKDFGYRHLTHANLKKVLALMKNHYRTTDNCDPTTRISSHIKIQPAISFINRNFTRNITLQEVAGTIHMSESRFRHFFKEVTNIGFKEYIHYLRLNEAKKLLLTTDMGLNEIIYMVGYSSTYQFYKKFQEQLSMTPNEYRKYFRDSVVSKVYGKDGYDLAMI